MGCRLLTPFSSSIVLSFFCDDCLPEDITSSSSYSIEEINTKPMKWEMFSKERTKHNERATTRVWCHKCRTKSWVPRGNLFHDLLRGRVVWRLWVHSPQLEEVRRCSYLARYSNYNRFFPSEPVYSTSSSYSTGWTFANRPLTQEVGQLLPHGSTLNGTNKILFFIILFKHRALLKCI